MNCFFVGDIPTQRAEEHVKELLATTGCSTSSSCQVLQYSDSSKTYLTAIRGENSGIGYYQAADVCVVLDGDIYNGEDIGADAAQIESPFRRDVWASAIAELLRNGNASELGRINGMYSLAAYFPKEKRFLLARDRKGYRMLYCSLEKPGFVAATRLWSVAQLSSFKLLRNKNPEVFHLMFGFAPLSTTVVQGIHKVEPGTSLCYKLEPGTSDVTRLPNTFVSEYAKRARTLSKAKEARDLLYDAFMTSLEEMLVGEKRLAVLLGGVDSAAVAGAATRLGRKVKTYSFRWAEDRFNQANVEAFRSFTGLEHRWMNMDLEFIRSRLQDFPVYVDEPRSELTYLIGTTEICGLARQDGFNIVATGDGAEDIMLGYPAYHNMALLIKGFEKVPKPILSMLFWCCARAWLIRRFGHASRNVITVLRRALSRSYGNCFLTFRLFDDTDLLGFLDNRKPEQIREIIDGYLSEIIKQYPDRDPVSLAHDGHDLHGSIRYKHAAPAFYYDVTVVSPFLSQHFLQAVRETPRDILYPHGVSRSENAKRLFREMLKERDLLPEVVVDQKKDTPGNSPIDYWLEGEFMKNALELIDQLPEDFSREYIHNMFERKYLLELYRRFLGVSAVTSHAQQALLGYSLFWSRLGATSNP